jgi:hypothetical protein
MKIQTKKKFKRAGEIVFEGWQLGGCNNNNKRKSTLEGGMKFFFNDDSIAWVEVDDVDSEGIVVITPHARKVGGMQFLNLHSDRSVVFKKIDIPRLSSFCCC